VGPGNELTLSDGTIVRVGATTAIARDGQRLALSELQPGTEVAIRIPSASNGGSSEGAALPRQSSTVPSVDADQIDALWMPMRCPEDPPDRGAGTMSARWPIASCAR